MPMNALISIDVVLWFATPWGKVSVRPGRGEVRHEAGQSSCVHVELVDPSIVDRGVILHFFWRSGVVPLNTLRLIFAPSILDW